ncbi:MAG: peptidase [Solirubrobacterales bacterium]|nr:peptidase [Solirubrobacterales bacterium]
MLEARLANLRKALATRELDAFVSLKLVNTYYLSEFTSLDTVRPTSYVRPIAVVIDAASACLVVPILDEEAAAEISGIADVRCYTGSPAPDAARALVFDRLREVGARRIGVEQDSFTIEWADAFRRELPGVEVVGAGDLVAQLRLVKDEQEIAMLRESAAMGEEAMAACLQSGTIGASEIGAETRGLVAFREAAARRGDQAIVDAIPMLLSGPRSSMPHEFTTGRIINADDVMWHCWIVSYRGYWTENIRTAVAGHGDGRFDEGYKLLHESLLAGQDFARPGVTAGDVYREVMRVLKSRQLPGGTVLNRSGHGMGLEYHEPPFLEDSDETVLEPGVVLTIEPGLFFAGQGGLALSNTLVIRDGAPELLTRTATDLHHAG